jgi:hypothetical protein
MGKKKVVVWYIHCLDETVNENVAEAMQGLQSSHGLYDCADGKKRYLYEMPSYKMTSDIKRSKGKRVQVFRTFNGGLHTKVELESLGRWKPSLTALKEESSRLKQELLKT